MEEDFIKVVKPETEEKRLLGLNDDPEKSIRIVELDISVDGKQKLNRFLHDSRSAIKRTKRLRTLLEGEIEVDRNTVVEIIEALRVTEGKLNSLQKIMEQIFE